MSYAGPFTSRFRSSLISDWIKFLADKGVPMTEGIKGKRGSSGVGRWQVYWLAVNPHASELWGASRLLALVASMRTPPTPGSALLAPKDCTHASRQCRMPSPLPDCSTEPLIFDPSPCLHRYPGPPQPPQLPPFLPLSSLAIDALASPHPPCLSPLPASTDPLSLLVDDALVASWIRQGLPSDPTSVQNGTILVNSERWPLMMDPQLQGVLWIKERESKNGLQVIPGEEGASELKLPEWGWDAHGISVGRWTPTKTLLNDHSEAWNPGPTAGPFWHLNMALNPKTLLFPRSFVWVLTT